MTTNQNVTASVDADRAKKLAQSLKSRFADLGVKICLNHGYEAVAALHNYPNWATMKAAIASGEGIGTPRPAAGAVSRPQPAHKGLLIGSTAFGEDRVPLAEFIIAPSQCLEHFYVGGPSGEGKNAVLLGLAEATLEQGQGFMLCDSSGDPDIVRKVRELAGRYRRSGHDLEIDLRGGESGWDARLLSPVSPWTFAEIIVDVMEGQIGVNVDANVRLGYLYLAAAAYGLQTWRNEYSEAKVFDPEIFVDMMDFGKLHCLAFEDAPTSIPDEIKGWARKYLGTIGVNPTVSAKDQWHAVKDVHGQHTMQFVKVMTDVGRCRQDTVAGTFWPWEVDFGELVDNNGILLVLLPHVEHVGDTSSVPGALVHSAFAAWLRKRAERGIARSKRGQQPFLAIFDEVDGYEVRQRSAVRYDASQSGVSIAFCDLDTMDADTMGKSKMTGIFMREDGKDYIRSPERSCPAVLRVFE